MKTHILAVMTAVVIGLALAGAPAYAEDTHVTVPFPFTVHGQSVPAGDYVFEVRPADVVRMRSVSTPGLVFDLPVIAKLDDNLGNDAKLVFEKDGDARILAEIWMGDQDGHLIYASENTARTSKPTR